MASLSTDLLGIEDKAAATGDEAAAPRVARNRTHSRRASSVHSYTVKAPSGSRAARRAALAGVDGRRVHHRPRLRRAFVGVSPTIRPRGQKRIPIIWNVSAAAGNALVQPQAGQAEVWRWRGPRAQSAMSPAVVARPVSRGRARAAPFFCGGAGCRRARCYGATAALAGDTTPRTGSDETH